MTNEEKARQLAQVEGAPSGSYSIVKEAIALEMAKWKKERMIEKATDWLHDRLSPEWTDIYEVIEDFKNAMKEE